MIGDPERELDNRSLNRGVHMESLSANTLPYDNKFFDQQAEGSLSSARVVLPILFEYYKPDSIVDIGCGRGTWLRAAAECGVKDLLGIDGDYVERDKLFIDPQQFHPCNLTERIEISRRFGLAISVGVAEHLPFYRAETFVADLVKLSDLILFSAALPYQGGADHVNEQWLEFWAIYFRRHGYVPCDLFRSRIWGDKRVEFWYSQNLLLFCKEALVRSLFPPDTVALHRPLSFAHPLTFLINITRYRPLSAPVLDLESQDYRSLLSAYLSGETAFPLLKMLSATSDFDGTKGDFFPNARTKIVDIQEQLSSRDRTIQRQSADLEARQDEVYRLSALLVERERIISALLQSRSWKLTRPLRFISRSLGGSMPNLRRRLRLPREWWIVRKSRLFDTSYYLEQNPDVAKAGVNPLHHYLRRGAAEGRDPHPLFDTSYYLEQNPDVAKAGVNPLFHYLRHGAAEGRDPHPSFDTSYYL